MIKNAPKQGRGALGALGQQMRRSVSLPNIPQLVKRKAPSRSAAPARRRSVVLPRLALDRYTTGLVGVLALGVLLRLPALFAQPVDSPSAPQAAFAAFVRGLSANGGNIKAALPWQGPLPADLTGGLPLFSWLAALPAGLFGPEPWAGRLVSLLCALLATGFLFSAVRRLAGGRAALFAALFMVASPFALYYGRAYLPEALGWAAGTAGLVAALRFQDDVIAGRDSHRRSLALAVGCAGLAMLVSPANLSLLPLLAYLARPWHLGTPITAQRYDFEPRAAHDVERRRVRTAWTYLAAVAAPLLLWWIFTRVGDLQVELAPGFGAGGIAESLRQWTNLGLYGLLLGTLVNSAFSVIGFLLVLAGLGRRARTPWPGALHVWALGGLLVVMFSASRLGADESLLAVLVPPMAALAGAGASWLAGLPVQIAAVMKGHKDYEPGETPAGPDEAPADGVVRGAVRRRGADPLSLVPGGKLGGWERTQQNLLRLGNVLAVLLFAGMLALGLGPLRSRLEPGAIAERYRAAGAKAAQTEPALHGDGRLVVAGSGQAEIFYGARLGGWSLGHDEFSRARLDQLIGQGATMLMSTDQHWLNRHADYPGLLASFQVATLDRNFIVFDLRKRPDASDSLYFLETGHTLRGSFRVFWETRGGVGVFGFPITEELQEVSPEDGVTRTVQYFERAILELHPENEGTPYDVMIAPVGRWLVERRAAELAARGITMQGLNKVAEFAGTETDHYFPESGHRVHGEFLRFWREHGGVPILGYPITEERFEVNPATGKTYIEQYFERARLEWHEEFSGTEHQVQLGLLGKEWFDQR